MAYSVNRDGNGAFETIHEFRRDVYIGEEEIGLPSTDMSIDVCHHGPGPTRICATSAINSFELTPIARG